VKGGKLGNVAGGALHSGLQHYCESTPEISVVMAFRKTRRPG
jgi:hypothetical protein